VSFLHALLDAFTPPLCVLCRAPPGALPWLCHACAERLKLFSGARCLRCGAPRPLPAPMCGACPDWPRRFSGLRSAGPHSGAGRELVNALKHSGELAAARPLGCLAAAAARDLPLPRAAVVVPVPLHWKRRRKRGFSPAAEIARVVAGQLGLAHRSRLLRRIRPESGVRRTRRGRAREVLGAFRARPRVRGLSILLVTDVVVTGETVGACARALFRRGAGAAWGVAATRSP